MGKKYDDGRTASALVDAYKFQEPVASQEALLEIVKRTSGAGKTAGHQGHRLHDRDHRAQGAAVCALTGPSSRTAANSPSRPPPWSCAA